MKRTILRVAIGALLFAAFTMPSCDLIEDCGTCEYVTDDGSGDPTVGPALIYCGDNYQEKLNSDPVTVLGVTSYWNCY